MEGVHDRSDVRGAEPEDARDQRGRDAPIVEAELPASAQATLLALFVLVASITVAAPVGSVSSLATARPPCSVPHSEWLVHHSAEVTAVVLLVLGVLVLTGALEKMGALP